MNTSNRDFNDDYCRIVSMSRWINWIQQSSNWIVYKYSMSINSGSERKISCTFDGFSYAFYKTDSHVSFINWDLVFVVINNTLWFFN